MNELKDTEEQLELELADHSYSRWTQTLLRNTLQRTVPTYIASFLVHNARTHLPITFTLIVHILVLQTPILSYFLPSYLPSNYYLLQIIIARTNFTTTSYTTLHYTIPSYPILHYPLQSSSIPSYSILSYAILSYLLLSDPICLTGQRCRRMIRFLLSLSTHVILYCTSSSYLSYIASHHSLGARQQYNQQCMQCQYHAFFPI